MAARSISEVFAGNDCGALEVFALEPCCTGHGSGEKTSEVSVATSAVVVKAGVCELWSLELLSSLRLDSPPVRVVSLDGAFTETNA